MLGRLKNLRPALSGIWRGGLLALMLPLLFVDGSLAQQPRSTYRMGMFVPVDRIETELKRGVSTRADVERVLGKPNGNGGAAMAPYPGTRDVWYYEHLEAADTSSEGGILRLHMLHQIVVIYFDGDKYDGFMWYSFGGLGKATTETQGK